MRRPAAPRAIPNAAATASPRVRPHPAWAARARAARDAAYRFMSVMAGNLAGFEEASRALFSDDRRRFVGLIAGWPDDIRDHVVKLAFSDRAEP